MSSLIKIKHLCFKGHHPNRNLKRQSKRRCRPSLMEDLSPDLSGGANSFSPRDRGPWLIWAHWDVFERMLPCYSSVQKWSRCWNPERGAQDLTSRCVSPSESSSQGRVLWLSHSLLCPQNQVHTGTHSRLAEFLLLAESLNSEQILALPNAIWVTRGRSFQLFEPHHLTDLQEFRGLLKPEIKPWAFGVGELTPRP